MSSSTRFSVAIHILALISINSGGTNTSQYLAESVNTNPVVIRRIVGMLKNKGLVKVHPGIAGAELSKSISDITLFDVYQAVSIDADKELFSVHDNPNPLCPVGKNIQSTITPLFATAQSALEKALSHVTIEDIVNDIKSKT
ncbi:Rrf2 family transcriptional regulator [Priestia megaterium]|uniref:Rrf2 family transcriptional regulator n=1 Tax=Priestia megaterium TaxID=1404 RepID=UPI00203E0D1D|nr:Rrf2 family transcriptional regulator [Priestia megaterium]MCM3186852.1 Rrf2 family transcriptional regulator [Priestia megaterium]